MNVGDQIWYIRYDGELTKSTVQFLNEKHVVIGDKHSLQVVDRENCRSDYVSAASEALKKLTNQQSICTKKIADMMQQMSIEMQKKQPNLTSESITCD